MEIPNWDTGKEYLLVSAKRRHLLVEYGSVGTL